MVILVLFNALLWGAQSLPPYAAKIAPFAEAVYQNPQGCWEARIKFGIKLVYVPAGSFKMGSPPYESGREKDEGPVHTVFLDGYWMGTHEITQEIWTTVMGSNPSHFKQTGKNAPVENISWYDAQRFLDKVTRATGIILKLPTEAQWEKACRGGTENSRYGSLNSVAWFLRNGGSMPHPVGGKKPNAFGLYDMLGNVWEWTADWHDPNYYARSPAQNPQGPPEGKRKVTRGGSFMHVRSYLRCAHRNNYPPEKKILRLGFRPVAISL